MKLNFWLVVIIVLVILFIVSSKKRKELFDNSGALMQLNADSVPTIPGKMSDII